ncbi:Ribosomal large subunit pseudouridine synthase E [compost metagenome]
MRYLMLNKPYDVQSQFSGDDPAKTLKGYVPIPGVYPVGRLDQDSEGLLILTDDGPLAHRLTDPRYEHAKTYLVQVERIPDEAALQRLRQGVTIQGVMTRPAEVRLLDAEPDLPKRPVPVRFRKNVPTAWLEIRLREGRNRQIRRMTAAVGYPTLRIYRVALGSVMLGDLPPGAWRDLSPEEVVALKQMAAKPAAQPAKRNPPSRLGKGGKAKRAKPAGR